MDGKEQKSDEEVKIADLEAQLNALKLKEKGQKWTKEAMAAAKAEEEEEQAALEEIRAMGLPEQGRMEKIKDGFDWRTMSYRPSKARAYWGDDYVPEEFVSSRWQDDLPQEESDWTPAIGTAALLVFCYFFGQIPIGADVLDPITLGTGGYQVPTERPEMIRKRNEAAGGYAYGPDDIPALRQQLAEQQKIFYGTDGLKQEANRVFPAEPPKK